MPPADDRVRSHLVDGESVRALASGRLLEDLARGTVAVALTDRRLLCVSETGEFTDVRYDYVCSVRSRRRSKWAYRPRPGDGVVLGLVGGLLALAALAASVGSLANVGPVDAALAALLGVATAAILAAVLYARGRSSGRARHQLFVGAGVLSSLALVAVAVAASSVALAPFAVVTLGGLALGAYAARHRDDLGDVGLHRRYETTLTINTIDGESVRLALDADAAVDRELSASVARVDPAAADVSVSPSPSD